MAEDPPLACFRLESPDQINRGLSQADCEVSHANFNSCKANRGPSTAHRSPPRPTKGQISPTKCASNRGGSRTDLWGGQKSFGEGKNSKIVFRFSKTHRFSLPYGPVSVLNHTYPNKKCIVFFKNGFNRQILQISDRLGGGAIAHFAPPGSAYGIHLRTKCPDKSADNPLRPTARPVSPNDGPLRLSGETLKRTENLVLSWVLSA